MPHIPLNIDKKTLRKLKFYLTINTETIFGIILFSTSFLLTIHILSSYKKESFILFWKDHISTMGVIKTIHKTDYESGENTVYRYDYTYMINDSLFSGVDFGESKTYVSGDSVFVIVQSDNHHLSRIPEFKKSPYSLFYLVIIVFPVLGILLFAGGLKSGAKNTGILSRGIYTKGKILSSIKHDYEQTEFKHFVVYSDVSGKKFRTSGFSMKKKNPGEDIDMVYDKENPQKTLIFDSINILLSKKILKTLDRISVEHK